MIAIIDYYAGNLRSVKKAFDFLNAESKITSNSLEIMEADKIVFPGVGSFGQSIKMLKKNGLINPIKESISNKKPFLGICLGMQLLFEESEEDKDAEGLGIFKGKVIKFKKGKVPQIGWNEIIPQNKFFKKGFVYFVNSFYVVPNESEIVSTTTDYCGQKFASSVKSKNITAVQFHPEKSGKFGLKILEDWLKC